MNTNRLLVASFAVFAVVGVLDYIIHWKLLTGMYQATATLWRPYAEMMQLVGWFYVGSALFAFMFCFIYAKGYEKKKGALEQGLRYGLYIGVLLGAAGSFGWYVVLPIPGMLAFYWFVALLVESLAAGAAVGLIYKH